MPVFCPRFATAQAVLGSVTAKAAAETGLLAGTPVISRHKRLRRYAARIRAYRPSIAAPTSPARQRSSRPTAASRCKIPSSRTCGLPMARGAHSPSSTRAAMRCAGLAAPSTTTRSITTQSSPWPRRPRQDAIASCSCPTSAASGSEPPKARGEFFGLASGHRAGHLHRAVMEGVAFAARRNLFVLERKSWPNESVVAAAGGARGLWLEIKASIYDRPISFRRSRRQALRAVQ